MSNDVKKLAQFREGWNIKGKSKKDFWHVKNLVPTFGSGLTGAWGTWHGGKLEGLVASQTSSQSWEQQAGEPE